MATLPLNIDTKQHSLPPTPQWSPIHSHSHPQGSPRLGSFTNHPDLDLSSRCRKLARSFGEHALADDFEQTTHRSSSPSSPTSPPRSRENSSESPLSPKVSSEGGGGGPGTPSTRRHFHFPMSPPCSEGSHVLNEILEEGESEGATGGSPADDSNEGQREELVSLEGSGFNPKTSRDSFDDPVPFKLSPMIGGHMSLHGASLALEGLEVEPPRGGLGLSLHDQLRMDTDYPVGVSDEPEEKLREQLKRGQALIQIDLSLYDGDLLVGTPDSHLDPFKTFSAYFMEPLVNILSEAVPSVPSSPSFSFSPIHRRLSTPSSPSSATPQCHVPTASKPLFLELILHATPTNPVSLMLQYLQASLQPLHDLHFLTSYCPNAKMSTKAPITVLISSSSPGVTDDVMEQNLDSPRIVYREISIEESTSASNRITGQSHPVIHQDWKDLDQSSNLLSHAETMQTFERRVHAAHERGFVIKVSGVPKFPEHERKANELTLKSLGVDCIA